MCRVSRGIVAKGGYESILIDSRNLEYCGMLLWGRRVWGMDAWEERESCASEELGLKLCSARSERKGDARRRVSDVPRKASPRFTVVGFRNHRDPIARGVGLPPMRNPAVARL